MQPVEAWGCLSKTKDHIQDYEVPVKPIFSYHLLEHWLLCFLLDRISPSQFPLNNSSTSRSFMQQILWLTPWPAPHQLSFHVDEVGGGLGGLPLLVSPCGTAELPLYTLECAIGGGYQEQPNMAKDLHFQHSNHLRWRQKQKGPFSGGPVFALS